MRETLPVTAGIHMVEQDGHFTIAVSLSNMTGDEQRVRTMDSRLFKPSMKEKTFTEDGTVHRWSPGGGAAMAVTRWTLEPNATVTSHYDVPNREMAREKAREWVEDGLMHLADDEREYILSDDGQDELDAMVEDYHEFTYVEPDEIGIVKIELGYPGQGGYHPSLMRQYDLRTNMEHVLDDELPPEDLSGIQSNM